MLISLPKQVTTTPKIRAAIQASSEPAWRVAERYGISEQTVWKWWGRDDVHDRSHTPHRLQTTLTPAQEAVAVALRKALDSMNSTCSAPSLALSTASRLRCGHRPTAWSSASMAGSRRSCRATASTVARTWNRPSCAMSTSTTANSRLRHSRQNAHLRPQGLATPKAGAVRKRVYNHAEWSSYG